MAKQILKRAITVTRLKRLIFNDLLMNCEPEFNDTQSHDDVVSEAMTFRDSTIMKITLLPEQPYAVEITYVTDYEDDIAGKGGESDFRNVPCKAWNLRDPKHADAD